MSEVVETESLPTVDCTRDAPQANTVHHKAENHHRARYLVVASVLFVIAGLALSGCDRSNVFGIVWDTPTPFGTPRPTTKALLANLWDATPSPQATNVVIPIGVPEQPADSTTPISTPEIKIGNFSFKLENTAIGIEVWDSTGSDVLCYITYQTSTSFNGSKSVTTGNGTFLETTWGTLTSKDGMQLLGGTCPSDPNVGVLVLWQTPAGIYPSLSPD